MDPCPTLILHRLHFVSLYANDTHTHKHGYKSSDCKLSRVRPTDLQLACHHNYVAFNGIVSIAVGENQSNILGKLVCSAILTIVKLALNTHACTRCHGKNTGVNNNTQFIKRQDAVGGYRGADSRRRLSYTVCHKKSQVSDAANN